MEVLTFLAGYTVGTVITMIIFRFFIVGVLRVDRSDPFDGPYLFLELSKEITSVTNKAYVILKVKDENLAPRK